MSDEIETSEILERTEEGSERVIKDSGKDVGKEKGTLQANSVGKVLVDYDEIPSPLELASARERIEEENRKEVWRRVINAVTGYLRRGGSIIEEPSRIGNDVYRLVIGDEFLDLSGNCQEFFKWLYEKSKIIYGAVGWKVEMKEKKFLFGFCRKRWIEFSAK